MINIKNTTMKNFLSIGNITQSIDFTSSNLTLILGENLDRGGGDPGYRNAVGKSVIMNALSYALYGQALSSIKKDNLINYHNKKNMLVTVEFEKNGIDYRIERGRKPNILKFYVNNVEQEKKDTDEQGDSRETQKEITSILGMSHDMFKHIISLNTYTEPFLSMRTNDQRSIIEQLLGITILSEKAELLKEQNRLTKEEIFKENTRIDAIKNLNQHIQDSINSLKLKQTAWNNQKTKDINKINKLLTELQKIDINKEIENHNELKLYTELTTKVSNLKTQKSTIESSIVQESKTLTKYEKELEKLLENKCPTCNQQLHDTKHNELKLKIEKNIIESTEYLTKLTNQIDDLNNEINSITIGSKPTTYYSTLSDAYNHRTNVENLEQQLNHKLNEKDTYQEQINDLESTALQEISWDAINELSTLNEHQAFLLKLLTNKDSFIRKKIIDQNLSYLNHRLSYYLNQIGLPHTVIFQNDLSVEITQLGQSLDFHNLSRGEMNRLILSLSWSFRDVWENLYQQINIMFVDELLDNGLDSSGVENALHVLKSMGRDRNKNIFLISHREELMSRVNTILKVIKLNDFTTYETESSV